MVAECHHWWHTGGIAEQLPPYLASEVSSRICALDPVVRQFFALDEIPSMPGHDMQQLLCAIWLNGYAGAMHDIADGPGPYPKELPELARWVEQHLMPDE